jgi:DNA repair protein RadC
VYVRELQARYRHRRLKGFTDQPDALTLPAQAARVLHALLQHEIIEVSVMLCLDTCHHMVAYHEISRGTLDHTIVEPRDIFKAALLANARSIILGHNHPSGDAMPSAPDHALTARVASAGTLIGIPLVDHIIVTSDGRYTSFKERGLL